MFVVSTPESISLVFANRADLENVINHLTMYAENHDEPDTAVRVYTLSDNRIPVDEVKQLSYFLKSKFSTEDSNIKG